MKPTSIIFLLVSLVILLTGWLICNSAEKSAAEEGIKLFDSALDDEGDAVNTVTFGNEEIYNKIDLVADEADVYIYGGYSESKLELVNFSDGSYRMTTANRNITVDTTIDLMSVVKFWESGFSFRGLRNYLHKSDAEVDTSKRINVYLPSDSDINIINVTLSKGSVFISNFDTSVDIDLDLGEGNAVFTEFHTSSSVTVEIDKGDLYMKDAGVGTLDAVMSEGDITGESFSFGKKINIIGSKSSVSLGLTAEMGGFTSSLSARHGQITMFGEKKGDTYSHTASGANAMITVATGDIIFTQAEASPTPDGDETGSNEANPQ